MQYHTQVWDKLSAFLPKTHQNKKHQKHTQVWGTLSAFLPKSSMDKISVCPATGTTLSTCPGFEKNKFAWTFPTLKVLCVSFQFGCWLSLVGSVWLLAQFGYQFSLVVGLVWLLVQFGYWFSLVIGLCIILCVCI